MASEIASRSNRSHSPSCSPSWNASPQDQLDTPCAALHTLRCSAAANSRHEATRPNLTPPLISRETDPFRKGVSITVAAAPGCPSCPVVALKLFLADNPRESEAPLFQNPDGTVLSHASFIATVRKALLDAGCDPSLYAGHSFCRGAASAAATAGFADHEIQLLGCWCSDTYKLYIEADRSRIIRLLSLLHWPHPPSAPFEPPALLGFPPLA
ncbi:hypothetical protein FIBSPDRAFT_952190 [Athelia psychrophila]|uniref:Tyr recombinase domain-containing protein n=1 Tax=Athelia psychrophila TaxID=1759441 RepID=A0A166LM30_9AGAM|nr:hypothetical protein FIBSPDRAFT_952190 [Fibularhizoctonia sp. CBS 109695]